MAESPLSDRAVYAARPTVRIDGEAHDRVSALLISIELDERAGGLSSLEARFSNVASTEGGSAEPAFEDDRILRLGAEFALYGGDETAPVELFRGRITGLDAEFTRDGPPELLVLAEDAFVRARMARRTKLHRDVTLADLVRALAETAGLTADVEGLDRDVGERMQLNESDLAFVRRVLRDHDADLQAVGTTLQAAPRSDVQRGVVELELFGQLDRVRVLVDLAHQVTEVTGAGWDPVAGRAFRVESRGLHLGPGSGVTGADGLDAIDVERSEHIGHLSATTQREAQALADAHYDQRARRFVTVEGVAEGNPRLRVGTHVELKGVSPRFDNTYYVVRARHRYDVSQGYRTEFEAESARYGGRV